MSTFIWLANASTKIETIDGRIRLSSATRLSGPTGDAEISAEGVEVVATILDYEAKVRAHRKA